jgi:hypothetical protein
MIGVITGIEYGSSGKDMDLLSDITKPKYDTIRECDENAYSFEKLWTNHKREVFTYQVFIYVLEDEKNIHGTTI